MNLFIYSHTHWDREWYLSQNQFQFRLIRTLDEIMDMVKADNGFETFVLDGQTGIIQDYLEFRPEKEADLRHLIQTGRLIIGPWYTMPDLFLPDGEALIRNLQFGARDCRKYQAPYPNVGYVPDSFGHIEQLPQIMRGVGIDNYLFGRGLPQQIQNDPGLRREFTWTAPDGSTVLGIFLPGTYISGRWLPPADEPERLRQRLEDIIRPFQENSWTPDLILVPHGIDHCWLQLDIPEILESLKSMYAEEADIFHGSLEAFVDAVKNGVQHKEIGTYKGQLRGVLSDWELHGTLSSRIDTKINNEWAQIHLESLAEPLDAASCMHGKDLLPVHLEKAWEKLLQNHAHDSICGCSQDRVHDDVNIRFREVIETGIDIADGALDYLNNNAFRDGDPTLIVFAGLNGGHRIVDFVIRRPEPPEEQACFEDPDGRHWPIQIDQVLHMQTSFSQGKPAVYYECRGCVFVENLKPCEVRRLRWMDRGNARLPAPITATERTLDNGRIRIEIRDNGTLDLIDHRNQMTYPELHHFTHETDLGGGYHFEAYRRSRRRDSRTASASCRMKQQGALRSTLEVTVPLQVPAGFNRDTGRLEGKRTLTWVTSYMLEAGSSMVRISTSLENTSTHQRLRMVFPSGKHSPVIHADSSFAVQDNAIDRWPGEVEHNSHPMRNWCSFQTEKGGLGILTRGLHEYAITRDEQENQNLDITLLRSVDSTHLCCNWMTPDAQLKGAHTFEYAICPFSGDWRDGCLPARAASFRAPAISNTHGDVPLRPAGPAESFATTQYAELRDGREILRNPNRSAWKRIHSQRDGWKRIDADRFVSQTLPHQMLPFTLHGENITVSAFKKANDGKGYILRLWSWHHCDQEIECEGPTPNTSFTPCDLLDLPSHPASTQLGLARFRVRPFQILTLKMEEKGTQNRSQCAE